jgi:hypothetical protein
LEREPECLGKEKRSAYMIALLSFCGIQEKRGGGPARSSDSRFETSGRPTAQGDVGISDGKDNPSKQTQRLKFWWVNQIDGFRPKQTQAIYLPCYQLDTAKFGPAFEKNGWSRPIKDLGNDQRGALKDEASVVSTNWVDDVMPPSWRHLPAGCRRYGHRPCPGSALVIIVKNWMLQQTGNKGLEGRRC